MVGKEGGILRRYGISWGYLALKVRRGNIVYNEKHHIPPFFDGCKIKEKKIYNISLSLASGFDI